MVRVKQPCKQPVDQPFDQSINRQPLKEGLSPPENPRRTSEELQQIFDQTFAEAFNTRLIRGDEEPIYLPADHNTPFHQVVFAHGFFSSGLHEIAHWCIAGQQRRQQVDYGYWYEPDGRTVSQQQAFEQVEVKPQALEWIFTQSSSSETAPAKFRVSVDNLSGEATDPGPFKQAVYQQVLVYLNEGLTGRALSFQQALQDFYRPLRPLAIEEFQLEAL